MKRSILLPVAVLAIWIPGVATAADNIVGRWCDRMVPNLPKFSTVMTIAVTESGDLELRRMFADGSESTARLREEGADLYFQVDSSTGDRYRIVASTGELQLIDNDGLIRVARRLENRPTTGECQ